MVFTKIGVTLFTAENYSRKKQCIIKMHLQKKTEVRAKSSHVPDVVIYTWHWEMVNENYNC